MDPHDAASRIGEPSQAGAIRREQRRQQRSQIVLPLIAGTLVVAVCAGVVLAGGPGGMSLGADLAVIYLAGAAGIVGLLVLVVVGGLAFGVGWVIPRIPVPAGRVRRVVRRVAAGAKRASDVAVGPIVGVGAAWAAVRSVRRALRAGFRGR
jgi:hypothetical protein